eukprot:1150726-Pelagomonas_calceolata.AAC.1
MRGELVWVGSGQKSVILVEGLLCFKGYKGYKGRKASVKTFDCLPVGLGLTLDPFGGSQWKALTSMHEAKRQA